MLYEGSGNFRTSGRFLSCSHDFIQIAFNSTIKCSLTIVESIFFFLNRMNFISTKNKELLNHNLIQILDDCLSSLITPTLETEPFQLFCEEFKITPNVTFLKEVYEYKQAIKDFKKNWQTPGTFCHSFFLHVLFNHLFRKERGSIQKSEFDIFQLFCSRSLLSSSHFWLFKKR